MVGFRPHFVHFTLPASLKKKKEFPEFFKKRVPTKSSKGVPAKAYSTKIPTENTDTGCI